MVLTEVVKSHIVGTGIVTIPPSKLEVFPTNNSQPLEVIKTTMAANRGDSFAGAMGRIWGRGGILGCKCLSDVPKCEVQSNRV